MRFVSNKTKNAVMFFIEKNNFYTPIFDKEMSFPSKHEHHRKPPYRDETAILLRVY